MRAEVGVLGTMAPALESGVEVGADRIVIQPGSEFELHTHPGAHILYVPKSRGFIHVDGVDYEMGPGDTVFVPAQFVHGVRSNAKVAELFEILAFGVPHMPIDSRDRMSLAT